MESRSEGLCHFSESFVREDLFLPLQDICLELVFLQFGGFDLLLEGEHSIYGILLIRTRPQDLQLSSQTPNFHAVFSRELLSLRLRSFVETGEFLFDFFHRS